MLSASTAFVDSSCTGPSAFVDKSAFFDLYQSHFDQIRNVLDKLEDFYLLPVEIPSRDVGRALVKYLEQHGSGVSLIEPSNWVELVSRLLALPTREEDARPILVLGPREWLADLRTALNFLNMKRDTIAHHLGRPLIWCGLRFFLDAMAEHAPDFWSIRNITIQIPLQSQSHIEVLSGLDPFARPAGSLRKLSPIAKTRHKPDETPAFARVLLDHARALVAAGRAKDAIVSLDHAETILRARTISSTTVEDALLRELRGDVAFALEGDGATENLYPAALEAYFQTGDVRGQARIYAKLARIARRRGNSDIATIQFDAALGMATQLGDVSLRAAILHARAVDTDKGLEVAQALRDLDESATIFESLADAPSRARVLVTRAVIRHDIDDIEGAIADLDAALAILSQFNDPLARMKAQALRGHLYCHEGTFEKAEQMLRKALKTARALGDRIAAAWALMDLAQLKAVRNDLRGAERAYTQVLDTLGPDDRPKWRARVYLARSKLRHLRRDWLGAEADAKQSRGMTYNIEHLDDRSQFHRWHAHMLQHVHRHDESLHALAEARACEDNGAQSAQDEGLTIPGHLYTSGRDLTRDWNDLEKWIAWFRARRRRADEAEVRVNRAQMVLNRAVTSPGIEQWIGRAMADLDDVLEQSDAGVPQDCLALAALLRGQFRVLSGMYEQAVVDFDAAIAQFKMLDKPKEAIAALLCRAEARRNREDLVAAEKDIDEAAFLATKVTDESIALQVLLSRALLVAATGDVDHAMALFSELNSKSKKKKYAGHAALADAMMACIKHDLGDERAAQALAERALKKGQGTHQEFAVKTVIEQLRAPSHDAGGVES